MKRIVTCLLLVVALALVLTGCGGTKMCIRDRNYYQDKTHCVFP